MDESGEARDLQDIDDPSESAERERQVSPDGILSAVANEHRRAILDSLTSASDTTLEFDALVDRVADRLRDDVERAAEEHRQRVRIALHHSHLPKLEAVRMVDYETETGRVQFVGGEPERELLALVESYDIHE